MQQIHIFDNNNKILSCCIKNHINQNDLTTLDNFLAYYGQNYKINNIDKHERSHICEDVKCMRKHIIDVNINLNR